MHENRPFRGQRFVNPRSEVLQIVVGKNGGVPRAPRNFLPVADAIRAGNGLAAGHGIDAVVKEEMVEVLGLLGGSGDQRAQVHQQAAVPVQHEHLALGARQRHPQAHIAGLPHRPGNGQVKGLVAGYAGQPETDIARVHRGDDDGILALAVNDADGIGIANHRVILLNGDRNGKGREGGAGLMTTPAGPRPPRSRTRCR